MTSVYLHRRDPGRDYCRCGAHPQTRAWGRDCPAALREENAELRRERDDLRARVEALEAFYSTVRDDVLHNQSPVADFNNDQINAVLYMLDDAYPEGS